MNKSNIVLLLLAATQALAVLCLTQFSRDKEDLKKTEAGTFLKLDFKSVRKLELSRDSGKESFVFERKDDSDSWSLVNKANFPVLPKKIGAGDPKLPMGLLNVLAGLEVDQAIAHKEESHEVLSLAADNYDRRIALMDADGKELAAVFVASGSRFSTSYLRRDGENEVYESDALSMSSLSMSTTEFLGNTFVALKKDEIDSIKVGKPDGSSFVLQRKLGEDKGPWKLAGQPEIEVDQEKASDLAERLAELRIHDVLGRAEDLPKSDYLAQFEIQHKNGLDRVSVNRKNEDGDFAVSWLPREAEPKSGFEALVPTWSLGEILDLNPESLKKPETPSESKEAMK